MGFWNKIKKAVNDGVDIVEDTANTVAQESSKIANTEAGKIIKEGAEEAGDFVLNSTDPEYWEKDLPNLRSSFEQLQKSYYLECDRYNELRLKYQKRYSTYRSIQENVKILGVNFIPNTGNVNELPQDFYIDYSVGDLIVQGVLSIVSFGVTDVVRAKEEAEKEANHLRTEIPKLEKVVNQILQSKVELEAELNKVNQAINDTLKLYGPGTTEENVIERQSALIANEGKDSALIQIARNMKETGIPTDKIKQVTGLSDAELNEI